MTEQQLNEIKTPFSLSLISLGVLLNPQPWEALALL